MERLPNSELLKIHTREAHVQLEHTLIPIIQSISSRSQYADLLKVFYTFYAPVEKQLSEVPCIESLTAGIDVRKADSLKRDIIALEASTDGLPLCSELPRCVDLSHAFGIMYVLEGSVLGGSVIANIVTRRLPTDASLPFSFFLHYNGDAKIKWKQFKTSLDATGDLLRPHLLSAATDTFIFFKNWIDRNIPLWSTKYHANREEL